MRLKRQELSPDLSKLSFVEILGQQIVLVQADHPAQFLEGGIFSSTDNLKRQLFGGGRRLWMPQMEAPYQVSFLLT